MKLRGIEFGHVLGASGCMGFFGEGYPYHKPLAPLGLRFSGCTFVAKTTTLHPRAGNMPLKKDGITPKDFKPKCIVAKPFKGIALNAVGLSGPGAQTLFEKGLWQQRTDAFFISFMSVSKTVEERLSEAKEFAALFKKYLPDFHGKVGLQINVSCPNVGLHPVRDLARASASEGLRRAISNGVNPSHPINELVYESCQLLDIFSELGIPLELKFNLLMPVPAALEVSNHPACDSICMSNTLPWGTMPDKINWKKLFGTTASPLAQFGGGGLSGKPLLPLVAEWIRTARKQGLSKPITGCGGVLSKKDVRELYQAGASAIVIGSMTFLRPWRVQSVINYAHQLYAK
ncbi:hypothetical protein HY620_01145 [Candidatus Uhrbacteria bacterium]|nr:hypothetical protein [Candidatus Uhrbacteria bacterium]